MDKHSFQDTVRSVVFVTPHTSTLKNRIRYIQLGKHCKNAPIRINRAQCAVVSNQDCQEIHEEHTVVSGNTTPQYDLDLMSEEDYFSPDDGDIYDSKDFEKLLPKRAKSSGSTRHNEKDSTVDIYRRACRKLRITPHGALLRQLTTPELNMRYSKLGPDGAKACSIALVYNCQVSELDLTGCNIGGLGCEYIAEMLSVNSTISSLILAENNISLSALRYLCDAVSNSRFIEHLDLSSNGFLEGAGESLADLIEDTYTLKSLNLSHNRLSEEGAIAIGSALPDNQSIVHLDLSWNHIRLNGAVGISVALNDNTTLKRLLLGWNGFGMEGCIALSSALTSNSTLEHLDLSNNRLSSDCVKQLCQCFSKNTTLLSLNLNLNPIGDEGALLLFKRILETPTCAIAYINIENQPIDALTVKYLDDTTAKQHRKLKVTYGQVLEQHGTSDDVDDAINDDPLIVLMEYMRQKNMRLLDLFNSLDVDGSKTLSRSELMNGLKMVNIPLSSQGMDKLLDILDANGDGEVDFGEMMEGQKEYRRRITKLGAGRTNSTENNTFTRIQQKVHSLLKSRTQLFKSAVLKVIHPSSEEPKIENPLQNIVMQGIVSAQKKSRLIRRQTTRERKENYARAVPTLTPLDAKRGASPRSIFTETLVDFDEMSEDEEAENAAHAAKKNYPIHTQGLPPI